MVSTPAPPDPVATAQAQAKYNQQTGATQQAMNMVDQYSPFGSSVYDQTGTQTIIGADGKPISVPKYTQTTTLSPDQQAVFDQSQKAESNLAGLASDQSAALSDTLSKPFSYTNDDASNFAYDLASPRILAQQKQNEADLRTTLANKGIREGSAAWNAEMSRLTNADTDQLNQLTLNSQQQGFNQALQSRQEPLNELTALLSGSQVANPQFQATPQTGIAGVDYSGLVNNQYQAQVANQNAMMGGLFGLASAGIGLL